MSNITLFDQELPDFLQSAGTSALTQQLAGKVGAKRIVPKNGIFRKTVSGKEMGKIKGGTMNAIIVNASPIGMLSSDPHPIDVMRLKSTMFVGDVITVPEVTPLVEAARQAGCLTSTGVDMYRQVQELMVSFLLAGSLAHS